MMTTAQTECCLVASVLTNDGKPGPCLSTALAYWPFWESPEASKLAEAITKVTVRGLVPSPPMVKAVTEAQYREWLTHPLFREGLPLALAEVEARSILPHYRNKRLIEVVATTYERMINKPEQAPFLALDLKLKLEELA